MHYLVIFVLALWLIIEAISWIFSNAVTIGGALLVLTCIGIWVLRKKIPEERMLPLAKVSAIAGAGVVIFILGIVLEREDRKKIEIAKTNQVELERKISAEVDVACKSEYEKVQWARAFVNYEPSPGGIDHRVYWKDDPEKNLEEARRALSSCKDSVAARIKGS
ncbi:MAG TPA: hypothetical protein VIM12_09665 [Noviherbaspirillum sp.]|jgi:hypothetical protein|uniref:hypothetical protein n=1 Tax=Noviherbaspirillum sp. TaxID=1926288 RepID=UPI002F946AC2